MSESESEHSSTFYDILYETIAHEFKNCPFDIACINKAEELDEPFTNELTVIINDSRANRFNYYYDDIPDDDLNQYNNYTRVFSKNGKYITIRDIINAMISDTHYHDECVVQDPHIFLEGFDKSKNRNIQYSIIWGS